LGDSEVLRNRHLRVAANRYMKCLADRFQLKIREGKTKIKSHRTFKFSSHNKYKVD